MENHLLSWTRLHTNRRLIKNFLGHLQIPVLKGFEHQCGFLWHSRRKIRKVAILEEG